MERLSALTLDRWQKIILPSLRQQPFKRFPLNNVTLLTYFFWDDDRINTKFYMIECAFLCAFYNFGLMPSILVVNRLTSAIDAFCMKYKIAIQVDSSLTGGLAAMSIDCVQNLHKRFMTDYVLLIQTDGMPIQPGLEAFVGTYDYLGAPWPKHTSYFDWYPYPQYAVGNGGFSLRSKRICEIAAFYYLRYFKRIPYVWWLVGDDVFYCKTLRCWFRSAVNGLSYAPIDIAGRFSIEHADQYFPSDRPPLAFHATAGFRRILQRFGCPMESLVSTGS
jgi:hypothetical protein